MFSFWKKKETKKNVSEKVLEMAGRVSVKTALEEYKKGNISRNELKQITGVDNDKELIYLLQSCGFMADHVKNLSKAETIVSAERKGQKTEKKETKINKEKLNEKVQLSEEQAAKLAKAISAVMAKDELKKPNR